MAYMVCTSLILNYSKRYDPCVEEHLHYIYTVDWRVARPPFLKTRGGEGPPRRRRGDLSECICLYLSVETTKRYIYIEREQDKETQYRERGDKGRDNGERHSSIYLYLCITTLYMVCTNLITVYSKRYGLCIEDHLQYIYIYCGLEGG